MSKTQGRSRLLRRITIFLAISLLGILMVAFVALRITFTTEGETVGSLQKEIRSADGTTISYEQTGSGPVLILVSAALADRNGSARLAKALSDKFTVINYDRRGRGKSGDTTPYTVEREVEDVDALVDSSGGSAFLFGSSSGAVLALQASSELGPKVKKLFLYEPPFIVDDSHPPVPEDLSPRIEKLVSTGKRNEAVKLFFTAGMGIPPFAVSLMRYLMPGWSKMVGMAHTLPYDLTILRGSQTGKPIEATRWAGDRAPTLVMVGSRSEPFFHVGAKAVVLTLPNAIYSQLQGGSHGSVLLFPKPLAAEMKQFFLDPNK